MSGRPRLGDGGWRDFGGRLTELAEHLLRRGIRLVYHHHMGTVVESEAEIDRLMAATGDSCRPASRHRALGLCRRRSGRPRPALRTPHRACPLPRMCGATSSLASAPAGRAFSPPFSTAS
jgi:hypothetical protein